MKIIISFMLFLFISNTVIAKSIELSFWFSSGFNAKQCIEEMVNVYNNLQSKVKVKPVFQGLYQEMEIKMLAAAVTRQLPDVAQEKFEYMDLYIEEGLIEPIDDFISEYDKNDIFEELWNAVSRNNKTYGIPFCVNTLIFFYNTDLLRKKGISQEKLPESWEEIINIGKHFTADEDGNGVPDRYAMAFWQIGFNIYAPFLWAYGGRLFSEDGRVVLTSEAMIKTIMMIRDLVYKYKIMPMNWTDFESAQAFLTGKLAMGPFISGGLTYLEENLPWSIKVVPMPTINGKRYSVLTGLALVNFSRSKKKIKAANDFISWLVNKENTITMFKRVGYLPVRKSAVNSLELKAFINKNPNFEVAINELSFSRALPHHKEYFKINQTLIDMLEKILMEGADPIVELKQTEDEINRMLE
jgi:sn-glycerol 3-phosphate transport system substrate-binding protein